MMQALQMIFYTGITLGVLIFIHELGHFLAAKLTGMRVDRFSIGFPPRAFGKKIGETDYCISWVPIGGYVKIAGMVDESFDTEYLNSEPQPWEFRSKPIWARMLVISAGVIMNIFLAIAIFWGTNYSRGKVIDETTEVGYVVAGSVAEKAGLQTGDNVVSIDGKNVASWDEIQSYLYGEHAGDDISMTIERGGLQKNIIISKKEIPDKNDQAFGILEPYTVAIIPSVEPGRPAEKLGLKAGDIIVALNDIPVSNEFEVIKIVREHTGKELKISWRHDEQLHSGTTTPNEEGRIGISIGSTYIGPRKHLKYSLLEAFPEGIREFYQWSRLSIASIGQIIKGKASFKESVGGPIKIAQLASQSAKYGFLSFVTFIAVLSMSLAFLNILPIPALDGGHLIMLLYEKVFRREIPHKVKLTIQQTGFILLLAFMAFVIYNDISNF
jgi:regulator of sigma E protease